MILVFAAATLAVCGGAGIPLAHAGQGQVLLPDESTAKANKIMQQAVQALGGDAYLNLRDVTCTGRIGQFDRNGQLTGYGKFLDYAKPPFMDRTENLPQHNEIDVFNKDTGWNLDRGGVSDQPQSAVTDFQEGVKKDLDYLLRRGIHDPGMVIRYDGQDVVDLKEADWVQLIDPDDRTIRIAFDSTTHLPLRKTVESRDPKTRTTVSELEYYSLFFPANGIQTPKQVTRARNGKTTLQIFYDKCDYNTGLSDSLFTKQALDDWYAKLPNKDKYHDKKKKSGKDQDSDSSKP